MSFRPLTSFWLGRNGVAALLSGLRPGQRFFSKPRFFLRYSCRSLGNWRPGFELTCAEHSIAQMLSGWKARGPTSVLDTTGLVQPGPAWYPFSKALPFTYRMNRKSIGFNGLQIIPDSFNQFLDLFGGELAIFSKDQGPFFIE